MNTLNAKSAVNGPIGESGNKSKYLGDAEMFFEERKVEELLERVEKRIGRAKEDVVGFINTMVVI